LANHMKLMNYQLGENGGSATYISATLVMLGGCRRLGTLEPSTSSQTAVQAVLETTIWMGVSGLPGI
jgi:hypothetical protein